MDKKAFDDENDVSRWDFPKIGLKPSILLRALKSVTKNMPDNTMVSYICVGIERKRFEISLVIKLDDEIIQVKTVLLKKGKIRSTYIVAKENEERRPLPSMDYPYYPFASDIACILRRLAFKRYIPKNVRKDIPHDYIKKQTKLILYLEAEGNKKVNIETGFIGGPVFGRGLYSQYEKEGNTWRETKIGEWIS